MSSARSFLHRLVQTVIAMTAFAASCAHAGIQYALEPAHASPGETVTVTAILFNDTDSAMHWTPPQRLVLQWRGPEGTALRSLTEPGISQASVSVPVNNFVQFAWRATVPAGVRGLQAVNVEGTSTLLALDTSPLERAPIAGTPAVAPVLAPEHRTGDARLADPLQVAAAGASPLVGAPVQQGVDTGTSSAFDNFRNALSRHDPVYFIFGGRGGLNARFQISFKYRLFNPVDASRPAWYDHFYLGYTQTSLWDLASDSLPFIDTSYNPSLFWKRDVLAESQNQRWFLGLTTGVEHKSNGRDGTSSRSINDVFVQPEFNHRFGGGSTLTFAPRIKGYFKSEGKDNPDIIDYLGYVDWNLRWAQDNGLTVAALYRQGKKGRAAGQLDVSWPLKRTFLNMNGYVHLQYFQGYGETLLGYRERSSPQVRVGLSLVP